jgi:prepilin-type N-terminal cleavage/methylation domain-containing protein
MVRVGAGLGQVWGRVDRKVAGEGWIGGVLEGVLGMVRAKLNLGFTQVELMVVVTVIAVMLSIAIPAYSGARVRSSEKSCARNRQVLDQAKLLWMLDNGKVYSDEVRFKDLLPEYVEEPPVCEAKGHYVLNGLKGETACTVHGR